MSTHCPTCGRPYVAERRQLRLGADEPEVEVKCKCDTEVGRAQVLMAMTSADLLCTRAPSNHNLTTCGVPTSVPAPLDLDDALDYGEPTTEYEVRMDRSISRLVYDSVGSPAVERIEYGIPTSVKVGRNVMSARLRLRSDEIATVKYTESQVFVCPGMNLCRSKEVTYRCHLPPEMVLPKYVDQSYKCIVMTKRVYHNDWVMRCDYHRLSDTYASELELLGATPPSRAIVSAALKWIHANFGHVPSLSSYVSERLVLECRLACPQILDVLRPPKEANVFRWKADGEQCWVVGCGYVWYVCRPNGRLTTFAWEVNMAHKSFDGNMVTVIRAEHMIDGSLIYIDMLCHSGVSVTPLRQHVPAMTQLASLEFRPRLVVRPEYTTLEGARLTLKGSGIPADGLICIERDTSITYRVKDPTADLMSVRGRMRHVGDRGRSLGLRSQPGMRQGRVYECVLRHGATGLDIASWTPRFDKLVPNRKDVVEAVTARAMGVTDESRLLMRKVSSWSFLVRRRVYETAINMCTSGPLIVDVGSGRMQSYSIMSSTSPVFLLCDPELDLNLLRKGDVCHDITKLDDTSIASAMSNCVRSRVKYLAYKDTIESLLSRPQVRSFIRNKSIPVCYSFSLSHTHKSFRQLAEWMVPQVGCCYLYDGVDNDGVLFDDSGVSVRVSTSDPLKGLVSMPPDTTYEEYALRSTDLGPSTSIDLSADCIRDIATAEMRVRNIFSHIYVVTSL